MIKETTKKIHFIAYESKRGRSKDVNDAPTMTLFVDKGMLQFSRYAIESMQMNNRFVRFFYDPTKKIIGWKVEDTVDQSEMKLWRMCKTHKNGMWQVSIKRMLDMFQLGRKGLAKVYRDMPVMKYRDIGLMTAPNDTYFYVEVKEEYAEKKEVL